jgi:RNA polymerase sigma factor for flagellar operon FliA
MSEVWEGRPVPADGGVRARNQQRAYLDRVTARQGASRLPAVDIPPSPPLAAPSPRGYRRHDWQLPDRRERSTTTARPA